MFGYVNIDKDNLLCKEYDIYKGIYCSLCKQMGKEYSFLSRFVLSYDCTFYAMLMMSLQDECPQFSKGRCRFNPLKSCDFCKKDEKALSIASAVSVISAYFKLIDNIEDSPFIKRIAYRLLKPIFSSWRKKAKKKYPYIDDAVSKMMKSQANAEKDKNCNIDNAADPTAKMLSELCEYMYDCTDSKILKDDNSSKRILSTFGYYLGRWIYLVDATDDIEDDIKHKNFNPYIIKYGENIAEHTAEIKSSLNHALSETLLAYSLLKKGRFDSIINNILTLGLPKKQETVLSKYTKNKESNNN